MEPKKEIKKFKEFSKSNYSYRIELPLGDQMFLLGVNSELPSVSFNMSRRRINVEREFLDWNVSQRSNQPIRVRILDLLQGDENLFIDRFMGWLESGNKINSTIFRFNPSFELTDRWDLRGCRPSDLTYVDVSSDNVSKITNFEITLHYDFFNLNSYL